MQYFILVYLFMFQTWLEEDFLSLNVSLLPRLLSAVCEGGGEKKQKGWDQFQSHTFLENKK